MERLHICIDCGGSKTSSSLAAFSTTPVILARGAAGPSNYKDNGLVIFLNAIRTATLSALSQALAGESVELPTVENVLNSSQIITESHKKYLYSAWIGASGVDSATDIGTLEPLLSRLLGIPLEAQRLVIANDAHIFASPLLATPESINHAVVAIAGTGSVVISFRRQPSSIAPTQEIVQLARAGGWGFLLGDEGSGFAAGREAIREVLRRFNAQDLEDTPSPSDKNGLTSILLNHFQLSSPDELFSVVYAPDVPSSSSSITAPWARMERKQRIVSLAPLVFHAAFTLHDDAALTALRNSVRGLASQIAGLSIQKKGSSSGKRVPAESSILVVGGSLLGVAEYRRLLVEELASLDRVFSNVVFVEDAAREGSLGLANLFR